MHAFTHNDMLNRTVVKHRFDECTCTTSVLETKHSGCSHLLLLSSSPEEIVCEMADAAWLKRVKTELGSSVCVLQKFTIPAYHENVQYDLPGCLIE